MRTAGSALLDRIGPCILVSHSLGNPSAWVCADARPNLVKAVIAIEPTGPPFSNSTSLQHIRTAFAVDAAKGMVEDRGTEIKYHSWSGFHDLGFEPSVTDLEKDLSLYTIPSDNPDLKDIILQKAPARELKNLRRIPTLLVTGEASYHAPYDHCTVAFLRQAGVSVDHLELADIGIRGNGHMMFMEMNNMDIADVMREWLKNKFER